MGAKAAAREAAQCRSRAGGGQGRGRCREPSCPGQWRAETEKPVSSMLSRRLGKRSLLGARVLGPSASEVPSGASLPLEPQIEVPEGATPQSSLTSKDPVCQEQPKEVLRALGTSGHPQVTFQPGQKVCVWYGGQECKGLVEQHSWAEDKVTVRLLDQKLQICCKVEEVWLAEPQGTTSHVPASEPRAQVPAYRPVSRNIDVPKRKSDAVEMDEMMAAMVLTSLSCSPVVQSPPGAEPIFSVSRAACGDPWKESGDISDSGSSGHWSGSSGSSTPSPPHPQASPKYLGDAFGSPQTDHGFETDTDPFLLDEPAPRKRKNSVKVMYKCLWPSCGKVLRSIVGIKRHVKALHLGDTVDSDQFKREEDFYYTEMQMKEDCAVAVAAPPPPGTPTGEPVSTSRVTSPSLAALSLPPAKVQSSGPEHPGLESSLPPVALSKSAPGSFWHIQADHAYQALPAFQIPVSPHIYTSISWAAAPTTTSSLSPVRSRSLSFSEPQQPPPTVKSHLIVTSPPRAQSSTRKARGEAKKCRKVYGIEHRDQWCTACRWKKACQRFLD